MLDTMIRQREPQSLLPDNSIMPYAFHFLRRDPYRENREGPLVRAATELRINSATEIMNVENIQQSNDSFRQLIQITDVNGHLQANDKSLLPSRWITIIDIAKDCQSPNVILNSAESGVYLKTIKLIAAGEPLLMWFTEKILALMNIPFLLPKHIRGQSRYTCDICNYDFHYPNPLKLHLALKCNHIGKEFLWERLARDFYSYKELPLNLDIRFLPPLPPLPALTLPKYNFDLPTSPQLSPSESDPLARFPTEPCPLRTPKMTQGLNISNFRPTFQESRGTYILRPPMTEYLNIPNFNRPTETGFGPPVTRYLNNPISQESKETFSLRSPPTEYLNRIHIHSPSSQGSQSEKETSPTPLDSHHFHQAQTRSALKNHHSAFKPYSPQHFYEPRGALRHSPSVESTIQVAQEESQKLAERYSQSTSSIVPPSLPERRVIRTIPGPSLPHRSRMTGKQAAHIETLYSNMGKTKKGHLCRFCGKHYSRKYGLKIHIRIHTGYKPLKCRFCERAFGDPSNLNKHVRLHPESDKKTPYRCDLCDKVLVRRRDLKRHIKSRHQEEYSDCDSDDSSPEDDDTYQFLEN